MGPSRPAFVILTAIGFSHLLNDTIQSILPAIYPFLKSAFALSFAQVGLMTLALKLTASLLQPVVGVYTDGGRAPTLSCSAWRFPRRSAAAGPRRDVSLLLVAAGLLGVGPHLPSGGVPDRADGLRRPARACPGAVPGGRQRGVRHRAVDRAFLIVPRGQSSIVWCSLLAVAAIVVLWRLGDGPATRLSRRAARRPTVLRSSGIREACPAGGSAGPSRSSAR